MLPVLVCLFCRWHTTPRRKLKSPLLPTVSAPSQSLLLSWFLSASIQSQNLSHLSRNLLNGFPARFLPDQCLQVRRPPSLVKAAKTLQTAQQRTLNALHLGLLPATPPQFLDVRIQKNRRDARDFDQPRIPGLGKRATPHADDSRRPGTQLAHDFP